MADTLSGAALVIHGGGPTPVLNASLAGLIHEARAQRRVTALYGAKFGVKGALAGEFFDLLSQPDHIVSGLRHAAGSAIGSSRMRMEESHYAELQRVVERMGIRFAFVTGGNGTQETGLHMERAARERGYELRVIGIPKTVDNDLGYTYFSPGYPTAARFFAHAFRDVGEDNRSLPTPVNVLEVIGRNAGWVTAATALARQRDDDPPHLIYLPERRLSEDRLCADVERVYRKLGRCVVAMCEGQLNERGESFGTAFNAMPERRDQVATNLGHQVAQMLTAKLGIRARSEKPGLLGRASAVDVPALDRQASYRCGREAMLAATSGASGVMVTIASCDAAIMDFTFGIAPLENVARTEKTVPATYIHADGNDVTGEFIHYAKPLVGEIAGHVRLYP